MSALGIAVTSRSFSKNLVLREELKTRYHDCKITFNDEGIKLSGRSLIKFLEGHDRAIVALEKLDESVFAALPELKVISKYGVGLDMIDVGALKKYGVKLGWTGGVNRRAVSELVLAFAISMLRHIPAASQEVIGGIWRQHIGRQLTGKIFGIIGCGSVGKDLVELLKPFDCKILVYDIVYYKEFYEFWGIQALGLCELLSAADIITLHLPINSETTNLLSREKLALIKPGSILINAARGGLVDEIALKECLISGRLAAAAFDVLAFEPNIDQELLSLPNFLITPHIGGSSEEAVLAMGRAAINGLQEFCATSEDISI